MASTGTAGGGPWIEAANTKTASLRMTAGDYDRRPLGCQVGDRDANRLVRPFARIRCQIASSGVLMRQMLLASILLLTPATFGFAQNTARMEQVVQSYVSSAGFSGTVL